MSHFDEVRPGLSVLPDATVELSPESITLKPEDASFLILFQQHPQPMWVFDVKTLKFLAVNDAAVAHYGYSREEFLNMRTTEIRPQDEVLRLLEFAKMAGSSTRTSFLKRYTSVDTRLSWSSPGISPRKSRPKKLCANTV